MDLRKKLALGFDLDLDLSRLTGFDLDLRGWWICTPLVCKMYIGQTFVHYEKYHNESICITMIVWACFTTVTLRGP